MIPFRGFQYRLYVDGEPIQDMGFIAPLKQYQLDNVAKKFAEEHGISWAGISFVKILNGVK